MNRKLFLILIFFVVFGSGALIYDYFHVTKQEYRQLIHDKSLALNSAGSENTSGETKGEKPPNEYFEREYLLEMDPATGEAYPENLERIKQQNKSKVRFSKVPGESNDFAWEERGPDNIGGRTRVLFYDPNDVTNKRVFAGGVSGGLWVNNDITNANSLWSQVGIDENLAITCYAIDPNDSNIWYIGTGESFTHNDGSGNGLWKTTNGGATWSNILQIDFNEPSSNRFYFINKVIAWDNSGTTEVFAAVDGSIDYGHIEKDDQGFIGYNKSGWWKLIGESFSKITFLSSGSTPYVFSDVEIAADNSIWVGTKSNAWGHGAGKIFRSTDGLSFTEKYSFTNGERVELSVSKKTNNIVYAVAEVSSGVELVKTIDGTNFTSIAKPNDADTTIDASDFTRGQAFYDLMLEVDPNDNNILYAGGIDLFRSVNAGTSWTQISKWSGFYNSLAVSLVHADQHALAFHPTNSNQGIFGNDGGVYYSSSLSTASASSSAIQSRNKNYNVTQLYSAAIGPDKNNDILLGGAQDNGSLFVSGASTGINSFSDLYGGDGAQAFVDKDGDYAIVSYVNNVYSMQPLPFVNVLNQIEIVDDENSGAFINSADLDENLDILYTDGTVGTIERISRFTNLKTAPVRQNFTSVKLTSAPTVIKVSPYTTTSSTVFIGTEDGTVLKVTNLNTGSPTWTNIDLGNTINTGAVSDIAFGGAEDKIMVTLHNYGVKNIYYTVDGGENWLAKDGNLPDIPTKAIMMNPNNEDEVIVGTNLGVWRTDSFTQNSPNWVQSQNGMTSVKVTGFDLRTSDNTVIASTYGRGFFTGKFDGEPSEPIPMDVFDKDKLKVNTIVENKTLSIELNVNTLSTVRVYSAGWALLLTKQVDFRLQSKQNLLVPFRKGIYVVEVLYGNKRETRKFIIAD